MKRLQSKTTLLFALAAGSAILSFSVQANPSDLAACFDSISNDRLQRMSRRTRSAILDHTSRNLSPALQARLARLGFNHDALEAALDAAVSSNGASDIWMNRTIEQNYFRLRRAAYRVTQEHTEDRNHRDAVQARAILRATSPLLRPYHCMASVRSEARTRRRQRRASRTSQSNDCGTLVSQRQLSRFLDSTVCTESSPYFRQALSAGLAPLSEQLSERGRGESTTGLLSGVCFRGDLLQLRSRSARRTRTLQSRRQALRTLLPHIRRLRRDPVLSQAAIQFSNVVRPLQQFFACQRREAESVSPADVSATSGIHRPEEPTAVAPVAPPAKAEAQTPAPATAQPIAAETSHQTVSAQPQR